MIGDCRRAGGCWWWPDDDEDAVIGGDTLYWSLLATSHMSQFPGDHLMHLTISTQPPSRSRVKL